MTQLFMFAAEMILKLSQKKKQMEKNSLWMNWK